VEILFLAPIVLAAVLVLGVFAFLFPLLGFVITLPFRILGLVFTALGWLIALPILALGAFLGLGALVVATLVGGTLFLLPFVPFVLFALAIAWFVKRASRPAHA
jgi:hypothetical protein